MAYIYKITNNLNQKCYIGKTLKSVRVRWSQHCREFLLEKNFNRPLYGAMKKYGIENFSIETIEEVEEALVNDREIYWISFYEAYQKGYNATVGGDGKSYLDYDKIVADYLFIKNISEVAKLNNCSSDSVSDILHAKNISTLTGGEVMRNNHIKRVLMLDKETDEVLKEFKTYMEASLFLQENGFTNVTGLRGVTSKLSLVCRGKRKTCAGFKWKLID